jgi:MerR family transcriptional regulator, light-induced transcriptional regulator
MVADSRPLDQEPAARGDFGWAALCKPLGRSTLSRASVGSDAGTNGSPARRGNCWCTVRELLTPKQVARAIRVSESSVKRWCDKGTIPTRYTAGGHRRIPLRGLLTFLQASQYQLVDPEIIGLPAVSIRAVRSMATSAEALAEALLAGDEGQCRRILFELYLAEHTISSICDEVLARAFARIGERWSCGEAEIFQERRGCELALRVMYELRSLIGPPPPDAPAAIGATPAGDHYSLANTMAELVLQEAGWNARSLGCNIPLEALRAALRTQPPQLFWLSCSHVEQMDDFLASYRALHQEFGDHIAFVIGGQALSEAMCEQMPCAAWCHNMRDLEAVARQVLAGSAALLDKE